MMLRNVWDGVLGNCGEWDLYRAGFMNKLPLKAVVLISMVLSITIATPALNSRAQDDPTPQPGEIAIDSLGFEMVYVPAGTFEMGIQQETLELLVGPLSESIAELLTADGVFDVYNVDMYYFWIDRYEVTIEQYTKYVPTFMDEAGIDTRPELMDTPQNPVVAVSWYEAIRFCNLRDAHLPTEEEWEYAASGPENLLYPWGNIYEPDYVYQSMQEATYPVGSKPENISWIGVYDMAGNVAEWVENRMVPYSLVGAADSRNTLSDIYRVERGGSYGNATDFGTPLGLTTFSRFGDLPSEENIFTGFRCARLTNPRLD